MSRSQTRLSFPKFESKDQIPEGYSFSGTATQFPIIETPTKKKKRKTKENNEENDSYDEASGNPEKKKRHNKSKIYEAMAVTYAEKNDQPKQKRGFKKGILFYSGFTIRF